MTRSTLFEPFDLRRRVFVKIERGDGRAAIHIAQPDQPESLDVLAADALIKRAGFETAPFAQLVIDREGMLVLANIQARILFGLTERDIGRPLHDLEVSYRPVELRSLIDQVYGEKQTIVLRAVEWKQRSGEVLYVDAQVVPLIAGDEIGGVGVTVTDVTRYHLMGSELEASKREAEAAYENLQSTNEELETTNEELQSTNEELETTNEELQSTNEELETMNEELQSTNEELAAINDELNRRTDELHSTNAFLASVLSSLAAGVAALDGELRVTAWNNGLEELWGLRADEAIGQNFFNLQIGLPVDQLHNALRAVVGDTARQALEVEGVNRFGRPIRCEIECHPLLGTDGDVRGVIVFIEATELE